MKEYIVIAILFFCLTFFFVACENKDPRMGEFKNLRDFPNTEEYVGNYFPDSISLAYLKSLGVSDSVQHYITLTEDSLFVNNLPEVFNMQVDLSQEGKSYLNLKCKFSWGRILYGSFVLDIIPCIPQDFIVPTSYRVLYDKNKNIALIYGGLREGDVGESIIYKKAK